MTMLLPAPYPARHTRVVTVDPRGNGRSDRPRDADALAGELGGRLVLLEGPGTHPACATRSR